MAEATSTAATSLTPEMARVAQEASIKGARATNADAIELADSLSKQISAEQVLQTAASMPDFENGGSVIDRNTSRKDKESKTIRDSEEDKAKKAGDNAVKYAKDLYLKGYENMTQDGKNYVRDKVADNLLNHPALKDMFANLPGGAGTSKYWSENMARRFLKDPRYRESMARLVSGQMGSDKLIEDVVSTLEVEVGNLSGEKTRLETRQKEVDKTITDLKKELSEYEDVVDKGGGKKQREGNLHKQASDLRGKAKTARETMQSLEGEKDKLQREVDRLTRKIERKEDKLEDTDNDQRITKIDSEIDSADKQLDKATSRLRAVEKRITEQKQIAEESERLADSVEGNRSKVEEKLKTSETEKSSLLEQLNKTSENLIKKQLELAGKKGERTLNMKEFVKELEGVFGKAANELLEADMVKAAENLQKTTLEKATKITNERDKKIAEKSSTLFFKDGKFNKDNIKSYRNILMTEATEVKLKDEKGVDQTLLLNGAEKALNQLMIDSGISESDRCKNLQDKTFVETQSKAIAKNIIAHKFMINGWSKKEMQFITESTWGKGLITEALQQKDAIKQEVEAAFGKNGKLFKSGEWLKGSGKWVLAIIAILVALGLFKVMH